MPNYLGLPRWGNFSELNKFCNDEPGLLVHHPMLRAGYAEYWSTCRNPFDEWRVAKNLGEVVSKQLSGRYKSGDKLPKFVKKRLHTLQGLGACPYCGLQKNVTTDHYLPNKHFPQFAVLSSNLVPACTDCQQNGAKGEWFPGSTGKKRERPKRRPVRGSLDRLLHPYFDKFLRSCVLRINFAPAETLLDISLIAIASDKKAKRLVQFHIGKLNIQKAAATAVRAYWTSLVSRVLREPALAKSGEAIHMFLQNELLRVYSECRSVNSIEFVFYDSILKDSIKSNFLIEIAKKPLLKPSNRLIPHGRRYK